jgi:phage terminase small subunit
MLTERKRRFAVAFMRLGNATRAAVEAGYSEKRANVTGYELVRDRYVLEYIEANRIRREVHGDVTYGNLINLTNAALANVRDALTPGAGVEWQDKARSIEAARRCLETLAKVEGLMVERVEIDQRVTHTLQDLVQKAREWKKLPGDVPSTPDAVAALPSAPTALSVDGVFREKPPENSREVATG